MYTIISKTQRDNRIAFGLCRALVNTVMDLPVLQNSEFLDYKSNYQLFRNSVL